jgi:glycosyltransferase involved in cell wall biosynthesis
MMSEVLVIIPAYNEEENIERVVGNLEANYPELDYVVVNDGSKDSTAELCRKNGYNLLDLPVNLGLAGGFQAGLKYAWLRHYSYAVQFDGDGQHRPEYIEAMRKKMEEGYDIVIGSRFVTEKKPRSMRMLGSNLIAVAIRLTTGVRLKDPTSGMRMFSRKMIEEFALGLNYGPEPDTVSYLIKQGARVAEVQVAMDERIAGVSYLNPVNAAKYMSKMLFSILLIQNFRKRDRRYKKKAGGEEK